MDYSSHKTRWPQCRVLEILFSRITLFSTVHFTPPSALKTTFFFLLLHLYDSSRTAATAHDYDEARKKRAHFSSAGSRERFVILFHCRNERNLCSAAGKISAGLISVQDRIKQSSEGHRIQRCTPGGVVFKGTFSFHALALRTHDGIRLFTFNLSARDPYPSTTGKLSLLQHTQRFTT